MSDPEALRGFAEFRAARLWEIGPATDILDFAGTSGEASTDLYVAHRSFEKQFLTFVVTARVGGSRTRTGSADVTNSEPVPDEAPLSDFDVLDELRTPRGQIRRQIRALRTGSGLSYCERLAGRLDLLLDAVEEEEETWAEDSPDSLRQMLLFLETVPHLRCPTITVTPSMTFRAEWRSGLDKHLAVDFLPDGQARFVVFSPDPRHHNRVQRVSGIVSRPDVNRAIEPYKVHRWAADAGT
jgi:hypothetical protein